MFGARVVTTVAEDWLVAIHVELADRVGERYEECNYLLGSFRGKRKMGGLYVNQKILS